MSRVLLKVGVRGQHLRLQVSITGGVVPNHHQLIWVPVRKRTKQHRVHDGIDRGSRADPERQRQYGQQCEPWTAAKQAEREPQVLAHGIDHRRMLLLLFTAWRCTPDSAWLAPVSS